EGYSSNVAAGILWAADHGADIINLSLGGNDFNQTTFDALKYAYQQKGITIFASSGNDEVGFVSYPAAHEEFVIAVGATTRDRERAPYSNYGPKLDIVAPGGFMNEGLNPEDGILQQTIINDEPGFYYYEGTSMAAPHAAALGALLLSRNPQLSPAELYTAITGTADDLGTEGRDDYHGYGLINPLAALQSVSANVLTYAVSDSLHVVYDNTQDPHSQRFFQANSGEIRLSLSSSSTAIAMTLYDPDGVEIASTEDTSKQDIIHTVGDSGGTFSVIVHWE
ncbi:MAG: S8 family serine peptidase, partial [Spirochaetota bacterium]